MFAYSDQRP